MNEKKALLGLVTAALLAVRVSHPAATEAFFLVKRLFVVIGNCSRRRLIFMKKTKETLAASLCEFQSTHTIVLCALMAALAIVLSFTTTINIGPYIRIGFSDLPNRFVDFLFGPVVGSIFGATLDILKNFLHPSGPYFPGFTLSAIVNGMVYGFLLYRHPVSLPRIILAELFEKIVVNCILNTIWISVLYGKAMNVLLPARILKNAALLPLDCIILFVSLKLVRSFLQVTRSKVR